MWGVSSVEVESSETLPALQSFSGFGVYTLSFGGEFAKIKCRVDYSFKEDKLTEGMYVIDDVENITETFEELQKHLTEFYGKPDHWANHFITDNDIWIQETPYGKYRGPELYWEFNNGFIGLIASRFKDEISIKVLYAGNVSIEKYGYENVSPLKFNPQFE